VLCESSDQLVPLVPILWRSNVWLVPERMKSTGIGGKLYRHETDFDQRSNLICKQPVIYLVRIGEVVDGLALRVFIINSRFIVKDRMEADIFETRNLLHGAKIIAIALAKGQNRTSGTKHLFPEVGEISGRGMDINVDGFRNRGARWSRGLTVGALANESHQRAEHQKRHQARRASKRGLACKPAECTTFGTVPRFGTVAMSPVRLSGAVRIWSPSRPYKARHASESYSKGTSFPRISRKRAQQWTKLRVVALSTLSDVIRTMGGELELTARFPSGEAHIVTLVASEGKPEPAMNHHKR